MKRIEKWEILKAKNRCLVDWWLLMVVMQTFIYLSGARETLHIVWLKSKARSKDCINLAPFVSSFQENFIYWLVNCVCIGEKLLQRQSLLIVQCNVVAMWWRIGFLLEIAVLYNKWWCTIYKMVAFIQLRLLWLVSFPMSHWSCVCVCVFGLGYVVRSWVGIHKKRCVCHCRFIYKMKI